jgi:hypothetical protein
LGGGKSSAPPSPTQSPTASRSTFIDLDGVEWAREAIEWLASERGILGIGGNRFDPFGQVTRAQFARFVVLTLQLQADYANAEDSTRFSDVDAADWFAADVLTLAKLDILTGYPDGTFRPNEPVTREQLAVILHRALVYVNADLEPTRSFALLADAGQLSDWASSSVRTLYRARLIEGVDTSHFDPQAFATRAQAAVLLFRAVTR